MAFIYDKYLHLTVSVILHVENVHGWSNEHAATVQMT